jgi:hypothetical protein
MPDVDQFRHAIDRGRTGDKVAYPDPAAAPLGTDDEAAGTPVTQQQVDAAWEAEGKRNPSLDKGRDGPVYSAQDVRQGEIILKRPWQRAVFILGLAGAVLLAVLLRFAAG